MGSARAEITEAALDLVGDAELDDFARMLTPERLATSREYAPSTVRYHFGGAENPDGSRGFGFNRRELALGVFRLALEGDEQAAAVAVRRWQVAIDEVAATGTLAAAATAIEEYVAASVPGASEDDNAARSRARHLAFAVADDDAEVARVLRDSRQREIDAWAPALQALIAAAGRRMQDGRDVAELVGHLATITDGHLLHLRIDGSSPPDRFSELILATITWLTVPLEP